MSVGFLGLELSAEHDFPLVGVATFNGGTFPVGSGPEYFVSGLQFPGGSEFDYEVDVSNSMLIQSRHSFMGLFYL